MTCPHLEYRSSSRSDSFDTDRPYCAVADEFVQPMRADICNDRFDLHHATHCEIFIEHSSSRDA